MQPWYRCPQYKREENAQFVVRNAEMMEGFNRIICLAPIFFSPSVRSCFNDNTRASFSEPKFPESIAIQGQLTLFLALGKRTFFCALYENNTA